VGRLCDVRFGFITYLDAVRAAPVDQRKSEKAAQYFVPDDKRSWRTAHHQGPKIQLQVSWQPLRSQTSILIVVNHRTAPDFLHNLLQKGNMANRKSAADAQHYPGLLGGPHHSHWEISIPIECQCGDSPGIGGVEPALPSPYDPMIGTF
jgi:hypothetical protein